MIAAERLAEVVVAMTETMIDDAHPTELLQLVTEQSASLSDSLWAGLLLADPRGRLQLMAASTESAELSEIFEPDLGDGPWLECFRTGVPVVNADLATSEYRWPAVVPRAVRAGFGSVTTFPLRGRTDVIGTLNLFGSNTAHLDQGEARIIQALADIASLKLLQERSPHDVRTAANLQRSLRKRIAAEQAKGALARSRGISIDDAADLISSHAQSTQQDQDVVSESVLAELAGVDSAAAAAAPASDPLLTPAEVAAMFRVDPKTIARWAKGGQLAAVRTLGGHRRYRQSEVQRVFRQG